MNREPNEEDLKYLQSINRDILLSADNEFELIKPIQHEEGDVIAAKEKLVQAIQKFVRAEAKQYISDKHNIDEKYRTGIRNLYVR